MERIEEFFAFKGAYEIESLFGKFEDFDDLVYRPKNLAILKYCYDNYKYNYDIDEFIEKVSAVREETNILQESMEEGIDETVGSLDEKDMRREKNKRRKSGLATRAHLVMRVTSSFTPILSCKPLDFIHVLFIMLQTYPITPTKYF